MQIRARLLTAVSAVITAVVALFWAAPAHAVGGGDLDTLEPFNRAGEGTNWVAITIVMVVLAAIVLGLATLVANAFKPKK